MKRALSIAFATVAVASCTAPGKIAVRAIPTALAGGERSVSFRVAEANGQFALGNVALALESYRKALREQPASVDAMIGMAACYDAMGRFDLSRRHYEAALAIEPSNKDLLNRLSASLLQQGLASEAALVRQEIFARDRLAAMPTQRPGQPPVVLGLSRVDALAGASVTIALPVARRATAITVPLATPVAAAAPVRTLDGPHLERISLGEVALVTTGIAPRFLAPHAAINSLAPPKPMLASLRPSSTPLLLLNAARSQGLAARTRRSLTGHGFGNALLGNADRVRATTVILAPDADRPRALRLARAFGIDGRVIAGRRLTMILGRDAVGRRIASI